jgi:hypothetical protein
MDGEKRDIVFVKDIQVVQPEQNRRQLLHGKMEVMEKAGIVDNAGIIDVRKTDPYVCPKSHGKISPLVFVMVPGLSRSQLTR